MHYSLLAEFKLFISDREFVKNKKALLIRVVMLATLQTFNLIWPQIGRHKLRRLE